MAEKKIKIIRKEPLELAEVTVLKKRPDADFWQDKTLDELADEQGVGPLDFEKRGTNWPDNTNFEEFIAAIKQSKKNNGK